MSGAIIKMQPKSILLNAKQVKEVFGDCSTTFYQKVREIRRQIESGRYSQYALVEEKGTKVNFYVYYDYSVHRKQLSDKNAAKYTPEFNPMEIAKIFPIVERTVVIPESAMA